MKIEHTAYQFENPAAVPRSYVDHLGMSVKRPQSERPFGQFLADTGNAVMLEFLDNPKVAAPDYRSIDPLILHIAFWTERRPSSTKPAWRARRARRRAGRARGQHRGDAARCKPGLAIRFVHRANQ